MGDPLSPGLVHALLLVDYPHFRRPSSEHLSYHTKDHSLPVCAQGLELRVFPASAIDSDQPLLGRRQSLTLIHSGLETR